jgi:hypothetical protein
MRASLTAKMEEALITLYCCEPMTVSSNATGNYLNRRTAQSLMKRGLCCSTFTAKAASKIVLSKEGAELATRLMLAKGMNP